MQLGDHTIFISIAHAAHIPGRPESCWRMLAELGTAEQIEPWLHIEFERAPPHVWSERQWKAGLSSEASHVLFLNDDLKIGPKFWPRLQETIDDHPFAILSLYCSDPKAVRYHAAGHRYYTSSDGLIGNAYVFPYAVLSEFLHWRENALVPGTVEILSEDQLINLWAMAAGRKIVHTIPSLVEHDTSLPSAYGNENNAARVSTVPPNTPTQSLRSRTGPPHAGRFFVGNHRALLTAIRPEWWFVYDCVGKFYALERDLVK